MENNEYNKLRDELSIDYFYMINFSNNIIEKTKKLIEMYLNQLNDEKENSATLYIYECLCIYSKYGFSPLDISKLINTIKNFLCYGFPFKYLCKEDYTKKRLNDFIKQEKSRNLKSEIEELENINKEAKKEIKVLEYRKTGLKAICTDKVKIENATHNNDLLYKLIEETDTLKQDILYRKKLIEHLKNVLNA